MEAKGRYITLDEVGPMIGGEITSVRKRWRVVRRKLDENWGEVIWQKRTIAIHDELEGWEVIRTLAHEIGHVTTGHCDEEGLVNRNESNTMEIIEKYLKPLVEEMDLTEE